MSLTSLRIENAHAYPRTIGEPLPAPVLNAPFVVTEPLEDATTGLRYVATTFNPRAPRAGTAVLEHITELLPRHTKGQPCAQYDATARRLADLGLFDASAPFDHERVVLEFKAYAHEALTLRGLPVDAFVAHCRGHVALPEEEMTELAQAIAEEAEGLYPFDARGAELDREVADAKREALAEKARIAREQEERDRPNDKPLHELDLFGIDVPSSLIETNAIGEQYIGHKANPMVAGKNLSDAVMVTPTGAIFIFSKELTFGLESNAPDAVPPGFVLAIPRHVIDAKTITLLPDHAALYFNNRGVTPEAIDRASLRDLRSVDGSKAFEILRAQMREMAPMMTHRDPSSRRFGRTAAFFGALAISMGARGLCLKESIVKAAYSEAVDGARGSLPPTVEHETYAVNAAGEEVAAGEVMWTQSGRPYRVVGRTRYLDQSKAVDSVEWLSSMIRTVEKPAPREATPISDEYFTALYRDALAGKNVPMVEKDELFVEPTDDFLAEFDSFFAGGDPDQAWRLALAPFVAGKDIVRSEDVEEHLRACEVHTAPFATEARQKILRVMSSLGFAKRQPSVNGVRVAAFVRTAVAS